MKTPDAPHLDARRTADFSAELQRRARAWIPSWDLADADGDFGRALLEIAARFGSEVAERLDVAGDKMRRGFLDWLAVRGQAARPARMPVVFKLADAAQVAVIAEAPVRLQVDASGTPVVFETEKDVRVVPGRLDLVAAVDGQNDALFLAPPNLSDLQPLEASPSRWQPKSFAAAGATKLQLDPEGGLAEGTIIEAGGQQYRVVTVEKDLVTIEPPLATDLAVALVVSKVVTFTPFGGTARNWQEHALYLGDSDLLNIEAAATIEVVGATGLRDGVAWQYWGKVGQKDPVEWQPLAFGSPDEQKTARGLVLKKPKGSMVVREIDGKSGRWIRAFGRRSDEAFTADSLSVRINPSTSLCATPPTVQCPAGASVSSPAAEGMANTTPLVLDSVFFPLGKQPRQFDAFYLGCQEAFSKKGAIAQLCFELADPTFAALSVVRTALPLRSVIAGVGQDGALHLFDLNTTSGAITSFLDRDPLLPPLPGFAGNAASTAPVVLDKKPAWHMPAWTEPNQVLPFLEDFLVGTAANGAVWVWREHFDRNQSGWINFGSVPPGQPASDAISGLVYLAGAAPSLVALRGARLFRRTWPGGAQWDPVTTSPPIAFSSIVPVLIDDGSGRLVTSDAVGMVGVSVGGRLFHVTAAGVCTSIEPGKSFVTDLRPAAIKVAANLIVAAVEDTNPRNLVANHTANGTKTTPFDATDLVATSVEVVQAGGNVHFIAVLGDGAEGRVFTWAPFAAGAGATPFTSVVAGTGGKLGGSPSVVDNRIVVPGTRADILTATFDPSGRLIEQSPVEIGLVVPLSTPQLALNDRVVRSDGNVPPHPISRRITEDARTKGAEVFYPIDSAFPNGSIGLRAYVASQTLNGTFTAPDKFVLDPSDHQTQNHTWLLIDDEFFTVDALDTNVDPWEATISSVSGPLPSTGAYMRPIETGGRLAPFMRLDPATNGNWDSALLDRVPLIFPAEHPSGQPAKAFSVGLGNKPIVVVLGSEFIPPAANPAEFVLDVAAGDWHRFLGDVASNPELSWEYWNGKGWWRLRITLDETLNLKRTGAVQFVVPDDLVSTDCSGKTNHWIRARLIGGDYGQEKVTVTTTPLDGDKTEQTIQRSTDGIRAPSVLALRVSYGLCAGVRPVYVVAEDSGSKRDQSDANRTAGAVVEAFVPIAVMLERLSSAAATVPPTADDCPPDCQCGSDKATGAPSTSTAVPVASPATSPAPSTPATGQAVFIGLDATLSEAPVNVLLLVEERNHTALAPMAVEALIGDRFQPIVVDDATRALGESGVLSMSFAVPPTPRELFGRTLTWLRLTPKRLAIGTWAPTIRGAYLNAVWASATETLTRELLGSSEGAPHLTLRVARPPVLHDTLELRVREPLGDEEREQLRTPDPRRVLSDVEGLPGDWVLWERVIDPADEAPNRRVYSLDEALGEVRFGDGLHGMIPPIGRDSIVAFAYKRTGAGPPDSDTVSANSVVARTPLNLVSPVESVESVVAADQAAGGAPRESVDHVVRFGFARLRHRERAVTARDIEDIALESSPDIVQARCLVRRRGLRLVIVMKGSKPKPTAAQIRELRRLLLAAAPASLGAPGALTITGPGTRKLRLDLKLRIERLDYAGAVARDVKTRLAAFFDSATGATDSRGWPLAANPTEEDVALALLDLPQLESIADVTLRERVDGAGDRPWPTSLKPTDIVVLADDPVRIQFETAEVAV